MLKDLFPKVFRRYEARTLVPSWKHLPNGCTSRDIFVQQYVVMSIA